MDQEEQQKQNDRIEKIEALLFDLADRVNQIDDQLKPAPTPTPQPGVHSPPGYAIITPQPLSPPIDDDDEFGYSQKPDPDKEVSQGEFWLNKIGIALLLLGLGFLFKYSVDQAWSDVQKIDFIRDVPQLDVPVYFFAGRHDYNTPFELVEEFSRTLDAPHNEIVWFENSAHSPNLEEPDRYQEILIQKVLPETFPAP